MNIKSLIVAAFAALMAFPAEASLLQARIALPLTLQSSLIRFYSAGAGGAPTIMAADLTPGDQSIWVVFSAPEASGLSVTSIVHAEAENVSLKALVSGDDATGNYGMVFEDHVYAGLDVDYHEVIEDRSLNLTIKGETWTSTTTASCTWFGWEDSGTCTRTITSAEGGTIVIGNEALVDLSPYEGDMVIPVPPSWSLMALGMLGLVLAALRGDYLTRRISAKSPAARRSD